MLTHSTATTLFCVCVCTMIRTCMVHCKSIHASWFLTNFFCGLRSCYNSFLSDWIHFSAAFIPLKFYVVPHFILWPILLDLMWCASTEHKTTIKYFKKNVGWFSNTFPSRNHHSWKVWRGLVCQKKKYPCTSALWNTVEAFHAVGLLFCGTDSCRYLW